ncbi:protein of unknown function [Candidatus Methylocalor cossyra]|uniref:Uncharacterized protein n=1 Tax=Candidatus Methylocalor cossyra TaxID=3108543 RepID=A0ABP1CCK9_9GAMM
MAPIAAPAAVVPAVPLSTRCWVGVMPAQPDTTAAPKQPNKILDFIAAISLGL